MPFLEDIARRLVTALTAEPPRHDGADDIGLTYWTACAIGVGLSGAALALAGVVPMLRISQV